MERKLEILLVDRTGPQRLKVPIVYVSHAIEEVVGLRDDDRRD